MIAQPELVDPRGRPLRGRDGRLVPRVRLAPAGLGYSERRAAATVIEVPFNAWDLANAKYALSGEVSDNDGVPGSYRTRRWTNQAPSGAIDFDSAAFTYANGPRRSAGTVGGRPAFFRGGGGDASSLLATPNPMTGVTAAEVFAVGQLTQDPPNFTSTGFWRFGSPGGQTELPNTSGVIVDDFGTTSLKTVGNPTPSMTAPFIYNVSSAGGAWTARLNGNEMFTTATNTVGWDSTIRLFQGTSQPLDGYVAALLVFPFVLTDPQRTGVFSRLQAHYSVTEWVPPPAADVLTGWWREANTNASSVVSSWTDKTAGARHLTPYTTAGFNVTASDATANNRTTYSNAGSRRMSTATLPALIPSNSWAIYFMFKGSAASYTDYGATSTSNIMPLGAESQTMQISMRGSGIYADVRLASGAFVTVGPIAFSAGVWNLVAIVKSASTFTMRKYGGATVSAAAVGATYTRDFRMIVSRGSDFTGQFAELRTYDGVAHDATAQDAVFSDIATYFAL